MLNPIENVTNFHEQYAENVAVCQRSADEGHKLVDTITQQRVGSRSARHMIVFSAWSYFFTKR